jgi:GNAT superfamily N-acetyltransferase
MSPAGAGRADDEVVERALVVRPANAVSEADLAAVFGTRGSASRCWCQRYKLAPREFFAGFPVEERAHRLREQTDCGRSGAGRTTGLVAFLDDEPVGWCAVEPRRDYPGLVRNQRVPWLGRTEDRADPDVWAVTCVLTRAGFRRRGIGRALVRAAVAFAGEQGAGAVEGYPVTVNRVLDEELHVGTLGMFSAAGLTEVARPTPRRAVMRLEF